MAVPRAVKILLVIAVIAGGAWLQYLMDDGLGISWQQNAVRNFQQFGLATLHGAPVINPGGWEVATKPVTNKGMSPICLYLAYFTAGAFSWTGLGVIPFHVLLAVAVFWGVWKMMGRDDFAFAFAAAVVLAPGYAYWERLLDMNATSVLAALPFLALMIALVAKPKWSALSIIAAFLLSLAFNSLNWTTIWAIPPCALLLWGLPQANRRAAPLFIGLAGLSCVVITGILFLDKAGRGDAAASHPDIHEFIGRYFWGGTGYGEGLTTGKAYTRVAFVNAVGLFPLFALWAWLVGRHVKQSGEKLGLALAPAIVAILEVAVMRNYFGHHPWMSSPVILVGVVCSAVLLRAPTSGRPGLFFAGLPLLCFCYGLAVVTFLRGNQIDLLSIAHLARDHTRRTDTLFVLEKSDPADAAMVESFRYNLDRHVEVVADLDHVPPKSEGIYIITRQPMDGPVALVAQSSIHGTNSTSIVHGAVDWFNQHIARRRKGDRMDLADTYYLYRPQR